MFSVNRSLQALFAAGTVVLLYGCGGTQWHDHYLKAQSALKSKAPDRLTVAESELKTTIELAFKERVPEKEFAHVYAELGDVLLEQHKYDDAQMYLLRTVQFGNALNTSVDENILQLHKLVTAYERTRDYEQAVQTQTVLVKLIELEKSPKAPEYAVEAAKNTQLKYRLATFNRPLGNIKLSQQPSTPPPTTAELKQTESMLTGWH